MLQAANIPLDSPFVQGEIPLKEKTLKDFFAGQGFFAASVSGTFRPDHAHHIVNITFECQMNSRAKISEVNIVGVTGEEAADVRQTLASFWARVERASLRPGVTYSRARVDKSVDHLRAHFRKLGRLAPNIRVNPTYDMATNNVQLTLAVDPGPIVTVRIEGTRLWNR